MLREFNRYTVIVLSRIFSGQIWTFFDIFILVSRITIEICWVALTKVAIMYMNNNSSESETTSTSTSCLVHKISLCILITVIFMKKRNTFPSNLSQIVLKMVPNNTTNSLFHLMQEKVQKLNFKYIHIELFCISKAHFLCPMYRKLIRQYCQNEFSYFGHRKGKLEWARNLETLLTLF